MAGVVLLSWLGEVEPARKRAKRCFGFVETMVRSSGKVTLRRCRRDQRSCRVLEGVLS